MRFEDFVIGRTEGEGAYQTARFELPVVKGNRPIEIIVRRFAPPPIYGGINAYLQWHLYRLSHQGLPHLVLDFAPRQSGGEWPSLRFSPKENAESIWAFNPQDWGRVQPLLGFVGALPTTGIAQLVHTAEILLNQESPLWPSICKLEAVVKNPHVLLHLYDKAFRESLVQSRLVGRPQGHKDFYALLDQKDFCARWTALFNEDNVFGRLYADPYFLRALSQNTAEVYRQPLAFCSLDLSHLPYVDAKWMAEGILIARIHEIISQRLLPLTPRPSQAESPIVEWGLHQADTIMDSALWSEGADFSLRETDVHAVLIDCDVPLVNWSKTLAHALQAAPGRPVGRIFIYAQCGARKSEASVPLPPIHDNVDAIAHAIIQLCRLKFGRDAELSAAEIRLQAKGLLVDDLEFKLPYSSLIGSMSALINPRQDSMSPQNSFEQLAMVAASNKGLLSSQSASQLSGAFPLGGLEDVWDYLPEELTNQVVITPPVQKSTYYNLTALTRSLRAPLTDEKDGKVSRTVSDHDKKQASASLPIAQPVPESRVATTRLSSPVASTGRPKLQEEAPTKKPTTTEILPQILGRVLSGVQDIRHFQVPDEKAFIIANDQLPDEERKLLTLDDLSEAINLIDPETFSVHVHSDRNDFAMWVEEVFDEKELAEALRKYPTPLRMMVSVEKFIRVSRTPVI